MPRMIKIISLSNQELIVEPVTDYKDRYYTKTDLSVELAQLQREWSSTLNLNEGTDYVRVDSGSTYSPSYKLRISGRSLVMRALHTIPLDLIEFPKEQWLGVVKDEYLKKKYNYPTQISEKECFITDLKFVEQTNKDLFVILKNELDKIHGKIRVQSEIMKQLIFDIKYIETLKEDTFNSPKYLLALSSLIWAFQSECEQKATVAPYKFKKGESILSPKYDETIRYLRTLSAKAQGLTNQSALELYNKSVRNHIVVSTANGQSTS